MRQRRPLNGFAGVDKRQVGFAGLACAPAARLIQTPVPQPRPIAFLDARLIDPAEMRESRGGALVVDGKIAALGAAVTREAVPAEARLVDCDGDVVAPGLIDMRAFIGEPGAEHRETIASASAAAAAGGVTTLVARPDTNPPVDDPAVVDFILRRARATAKVRVLPCAALTKGLEGREIAEIGLLAEAGAVAFSDGPLQRRQRADDAARADLRARFRRAGHALLRGSRPSRRRGDGGGRARQPARPRREFRAKPKRSCSSAICASSR